MKKISINKLIIKTSMSTLEIEKIPKELIEQPTPYKFWERIYLNYVHPRPICNTCDSPIDDPNEWISFSCKCQKYFHKECIHQTFEILICPECNDCKQIYTFPKFLCKFMPVEKYYQIYQNSIQDIESNNPSTKLKFYKLWFQTYSIYTPPFLKLYDYLQPHDPYSTIQFLESKKNTHRIECFDPAYTVEEDGMTYETEKINYFGHKVFVELPEFRRRLREYSYDLLGDNFPYQSHVVLAGGAVHKCLESRIDLNTLPKYSNLDIFICHPDLKVITKDTKKVIKYLQERHGEHIFWVRKNTNVLRLYVPGYNRVVQLIMFKNTIENIVSRFDFSHVQYVYDGSDILTTLSGIEYANNLVSVHNGYYDCSFGKRFQKAKQLSLCIALPMIESMTLNLPKNINIDSWCPNYTDTLDTVKHQMKSLSCIKSQYVTQSKPCRILYSKIPEEFSHGRLLALDHISNNSDDEIISYIEQETIQSTFT